MDANKKILFGLRANIAKQILARNLKEKEHIQITFNLGHGTRILRGIITYILDDIDGQTFLIKNENYIPPFDVKYHHNTFSLFLCPEYRTVALYLSNVNQSGIISPLKDHSIGSLILASEKLEDQEVDSALAL